MQPEVPYLRKSKLMQVSNNIHVGRRGDWVDLLPILMIENTDWALVINEQLTYPLEEADHVVTQAGVINPFIRAWLRRSKSIEPTTQSTETKLVFF